MSLGAGTTGVVMPEEEMIAGRVAATSVGDETGAKAAPMKRLTSPPSARDCWCGGTATTAVKAWFGAEAAAALPALEIFTPAVGDAFTTVVAGHDTSLEATCGERARSCAIPSVRTATWDTLC